MTPKHTAEGHYLDDGSWVTNSPLFRSLDPDEVEQFKQYARDNLPPTKNIEICHPFCREVWITPEK